MTTPFEDRVFLHTNIITFKSNNISACTNQVYTTYIYYRLTILLYAFQPTCTSSLKSGHRGFVLLLSMYTINPTYVCHACQRDVIERCCYWVSMYSTYTISMYTYIV